jgi:glycine cleavage system H protein
VKRDQLLYAETHEWVSISDHGGKKWATVGISEFAVKQLTDLVFMALPKVGTRVQAGQSFGEIESVKAVSDLYSPVTGTVMEVNSKLPDSLEILSKDPYEAGWIAKIEVEDESTLGKLMSYAAYEQQCAADH